MQKLQLYIEGQRVDLFKDEVVNITQTIQNVKDIGKIFTDFTKTFSVPATPINNKIFKHYYNFNIQGGFDARIKKEAIIELNNLTFKNGKIKLEGVDLKDNIAHTYKITFFGSTVTLKDVLGEDKLQGLDLSAFDTVYTSAEVEAKLTTDPSVANNHLIAPLITHTQRLTYDSTSGNHDAGNLYYHSGDGSANHHGVLWSDLKYALRIHEIVKAIEVKYSELKFSDDFFNTTNDHYYNLFMWLHRKKGAVENLSGVNEAIVDGWLAPIQDYNDTLTKMVNSFTLGVIGEPNNYGICTLSLNTSSTDNYAVSIQKDGVEVYNTGTVNGNQTIFVSDFGLEQGEYTILIESAADITFSSIVWNINYLSFNKTYATTTYDYISVFNFIISQQIPEMKVIDFLTGLFKMFNLTAFIDNNTNEIIVKTLDEFYNDGGSYDITQYVDVSKSSVNIALPYKEINFEYEDTKTFLASKHNQLFGKTWSKESYVGGEKLDGGIYNVKVPFSQLKYERLVDENGGGNTTIQYGYFVDDNQDSYYGKPLLFYPILSNIGTTLNFLTSETSHVPKISYNVPSNSVSLSATTNKKNINFFAETNEYDSKGSFTDTLFKMYYEKYITDVFNSANRITKVSAYLPLRILLNYTLADRFVINNNSYKINSINTNLQTGKSELELLNEL